MWKILKFIIKAYKYCLMEHKNKDGFWIGATGLMNLLLIPVFIVDVTLVKAQPFELEESVVVVILLIFALLPLWFAAKFIKDEEF